MDTLFPFGFPLPTGFYLVAYIVTLMIHVAFMNYVLAGSLYIALAGWTRGRGLFDEGLIRPAAVLIDWLPVFLSGAITAAIAPLLFLQILYKVEFYTANLLLFNRWMAILPVLIVGFYAMYVLKTAWIRRQRAWVIGAIATVPFACIAFTGFSWTENHLLSVRGQAFWSEFYRDDPTFYYEPQLLPRLLVWAFGAVPTFALLISWQLAWMEGRGRPTAPGSPRALATLAGFGMVLVGAAGLWYVQVAGTTARDAFFSDLAWPYFLVACLGLAVQAVGWFVTWIKGAWERRWLAFISLGLFLTVLGMSVCREAIRLRTLGEDRLVRLFEEHARAARVGGLVVFLVFFVLNAGLITLCFVLARRGKV